MEYRTTPHFIVKKNLQKSKNTGVYFSDVLTEGVLADVCRRITGKRAYTVDFVDDRYRDEFLSDTYNKGRLAILQYEDTAHYVSFSEAAVNGRNSSVQSVPTAFNLFYANPYPHKRLHYYFLNVKAGNLETDYLILMYRLMRTIGFDFLNADEALTRQIQPFSSVEDIMANRKLSSGRNRGNHATYITKSDTNTIDIYGKVYGANKYESTMMCYAMSRLRHGRQKITLYEVLDNDLKRLPEVSRRIIEQMGAMKIVATDIRYERESFEQSDSLRSPRYLYNLLERLGPKRCALCGCAIPELVQGAHVWPVAQIKQEGGMTFEAKLECATDGHNGLWLCENHHKLFDENLLMISEDGTIRYSERIPQDQQAFIARITPQSRLPESLLSEKFKEYLSRRNAAI